MELAGRPAKSYFNCNSQVWTEQEPEQGVVYSICICIVLLQYNRCKAALHEIKFLQ